jgi:carboxyl-terminal processing protease
MKVYRAIALLTLLALLSPLFAQQTTAPNGEGAARRARLSKSNEIAEVEQSFAEALSLVEANYVDGARLNYNNLIKSSIIGMLRSLDPHSNYYDRKEFEELRNDQRSEYFGIGASIVDRRVGDQVDTYILATFENSPAALAGLRFGDRIVAVDGQPMHGRPSAEVRDRIRGPRGTVVKLTVERAATGRIETVEITRDAVPQPSVPDAYVIRPGVGYIDMTRGFNVTTADELEEALEKLHQRGVTGLILDLRNNPGGFLDQAIRVAEKFLSDGQVILTQKGRNFTADRTYRATNGSPDTTPLVILINRGTASASEIVAGAMQDHDRALIVGENSFGKGLVQSIIPLDYGAGLTLTSAKYYTPSGRLIQRDYTNSSYYDYITRGGVGNQDEETTINQTPTGPESHTDTGRPVYGGGGIMPDELVKPRLIKPEQQRLIDPIFAFVRELVNGRIAGFESYKVQRPIEYDHELQPTDFPVTDALYEAFKSFVNKSPAYKNLSTLVDANQDFVRRQLRYDIITAAYGTVTATRVYILDDPQVLKAIELLPRARELAMAARNRTPRQKSFE